MALPVIVAGLLGVAARVAVRHGVKKALRKGAQKAAKKTVTKAVKQVGKRAATKSAKTVTKCPRGGCTITLKPKQNWSPRQMKDFERKVKELNKAKLKVNKRIKRDQTEISKFTKNNGKTGKRSDIDHKQDLQLGGKDQASNMWKLDKSVNRSVGRQIAHQIKDLKHGARVKKIRIDRRTP